MLRRRFCILTLALSFLFASGGATLAQGLISPTVALAATNTTSAPAYTRALKRGCRGADVKALQKKLKELGFYKSTVDGVFGRGTENAVKTFQRAHALKADGIVGRKTHSAIYGTPTSTPSDSDGSDGSGGSDSGSTGGNTVDGYKLGKLDNQVTLRKGNKGSNVKDLQAVLKMKGFYSGPINGNFLTQTKNSVMSFQHSVGLDSDGVAGNYTLSALYTMLNPPDLNSIKTWPDGRYAYSGMKIEKLTWSVASGSAFKRGMDAVVVDVRTGYRFHVRRTGGTNHADVETVAPVDTATFYKSNGNFSWARRPIWVIVGGRRLAASMNCMPHGYDTLPDNDFKGQFCIHFVNSRTHGSNRVDPDHQKCIEEAYKAGLADTGAPSAPPTASPSPSPSPSPSISPTVSDSASPSASPTGSPSPDPTTGSQEPDPTQQDPDYGGGQILPQ